MSRSLLALACALVVAPLAANAGTLVNLKNPAGEGIQLSFQLTDGRVLGQSFNDQHWYILTPDNKGSYVNGTWGRAADMLPDRSPDAFASAVLADGRVVVQGGEYDFGGFTLTRKGEVYDPQKNTWTNLKAPFRYIGDSGAGVLADGRYFVLDKLNKKMAALDPSSMTWAELPTTGKNDFNSEEGPVLLPDGSLLVVDVKQDPHTERYFPSEGTWHNAGDTPQTLKEGPCCSCQPYGPKGKCYFPPGETGPAILRPDGTVFATGALPASGPAHTAIYDPSKNKWSAGPDFPAGDDAGDNFAALLPSGNVLVEGNSGNAYEFDGTNLVKQSGVCLCRSSLMVLPTGEVLVAGSAVYQGSGKYKAAWQPTISSAPASTKRGSTYQISGTQFNGLSQANGFGDEYMTYTNYPLVRITNNGTGHVFYAHTHDHSTMGVATGNATVSTNFDVPSGMETGASLLVVVANGIPSQPVSITVN
jgi:hypothetical protein